MTPTAYDIVNFRPEHQDGVLAVLAGLWPYERERAERLFRWKYLENPCAAPLGVVALHRSVPVGFRGYVAARFTAGNEGRDIGVLYPCDTVVAPEHRNQGLSTAMGRQAAEFGEAGFRFFLNFTSGRNSEPGYQSLGFRPLAKRVPLQRHGRNPVLWAIGIWSRRAERASDPSARRRIRFGRFGDIVAADAPRPPEMAAIAGAEPQDGPALRMRQDERFFAWRYRNPVRQYAFYFRKHADGAGAYLVLDVSPDGRNGAILDYAEARAGGLRRILEHVCRSRDFPTLSVLSYGVDARLGAILRELGFTRVHTTKTVLRQGSAESLAPSVLLRPVGQAVDDEAFRVGALDARRPEHWRLKPICSDGA